MTTDGADDVLRAIAAAVCELLGADRCSVYLRDDEAGTFRGRVGRIRATGADIDAEVRRLVAGIEADGLTREILDTGRPVLVDDARVDPRPVRAAMRAFDVRALLGVPLSHDGVVLGLAFLDRADPFGEPDARAAAALSPLAGAAIAQARACEGARGDLRGASRHNAVLRHAAALDERLHRAMSEGGGLGALAAVVADGCAKAIAILDDAGRPVAVAPPGAAADALRARLDRLDRLAPGDDRALSVTPIELGGESLGSLVVAHDAAPLGALDRHAARRAATLAALELAARRRVSAAERDSREALLSDLIRGDRDPASLARRAAELRVNLEAPQLLCLIAGAAPPPGADALSEAVARQLGLRSLPAAALAGSVALLVPLASGDRRHVERVRNAVAEALADRRGLAAAISEPVRGPGEVRHAHEEALGVLRCLQNLSPGGAVRALCAHELGAGRVFLGSVDPAEAERFARRALGALRGPGSAPELLDTVQEFFARGRGIRQTASALGVHENTIRYRFTRVREMTGLDVYGDADDQTTALLALRVLQLQGVRPWNTPGAAERVLAAVKTS